MSLANALRKAEAKPVPFWDDPEKNAAVRNIVMSPATQRAMEVAAPGGALMNERRFPEAAAIFEQALKLAPANAIILFHLATCYLEGGRLEDALRLFDQVIAIRKGWAEALNNKASCLARLGRFPAALEAVQASIAAKETGAAYSNLCSILAALGREKEAWQAGEKSTQLDPKNPQVWLNLSVAYRSVWRLEDAATAVQKAIELDPNNYMGWTNLGGFRNLQGRMSEAWKHTERATWLAPTVAVVRANHVMYTDLLPETTLAEAYAARRTWNTFHAAPFKQFWRPHENARDPGKRLRVGLVGSDFRQHSAVHIFGAVMLAHDPKEVELFVYAGNHNEDEVTARLRQAPALGTWHVTSGWSDQKLAEQVRADGIDILVDLAAYTAGGRLQMFGYKPAPIQITAWGYAAGTGLDAMDCFFADPVTVPTTHEWGYRERVVRLPSILCFDPFKDLPDPSPPPKAARGYVTFGSFNRVEKVSDQMLVWWSEILKRVPDARMIFKFGGLDGDAASRLRRGFQRQGIAADRIETIGHTDHLNHLLAYENVDIALDTWPHGGGITTLEAAWMGVPSVTLLGERIPSRLAGSILTTLELPEWVTTTPEQYIAVAVEQAANDLTALRQELPARVRKSPIGDTVLYTRYVEQAYRGLWKEYCAGRPVNGRRELGMTG